MRPKLKDSEKKKRLTFTINYQISEILDNKISNKSKYIENLIIKDLKKNNLIDDEFLP